MSGFGSWFGFLGGSNEIQELPELFPLGVQQVDFIRIDVMNIYTKILTDALERAEGLGEDEIPLLWDNCLASESSEGLVSLLARAMYDKAELFLVIDKATKVLRKATADETAQIREDYKKQAESKVGVYISFAKYRRTDMIRLYSALEYCTVAALNKSMNLSKAVQLKISELRSTVALADKAEAKAQGVSLAQGLSKGKDVMLDSKDTIETAKPDLTSTQASLEMLNEKRSFYLGLPCSYITGELNSGLGDSGQADAKAIERGLKNYFFSIIKPVCKALFAKDLTFKSEDFQMLATGLELLKTLEVTSEEFMSAENKLKLVNKVFGFPTETKGGPPPAPAPAPVIVVPPSNAPPKNEPNPGAKP